MTRKHILQNEASVRVKELTVLKIKQWEKQTVDVRHLQWWHKRQHGLASPEGRAQGQAGVLVSALTRDSPQVQSKNNKGTIKKHWPVYLCSISFCSDIPWLLFLFSKPLNETILIQLLLFNLYGVIMKLIHILLSENSMENIMEMNTQPKDLNCCL